MVQEAGGIREPQESGIHGIRTIGILGTAETRDRQEADVRSQTASDQNRSGECVIRSGGAATLTAMETPHTAMTGSASEASSGMSYPAQ